MRRHSKKNSETQTVVICCFHARDVSASMQQCIHRRVQHNWFSTQVCVEELIVLDSGPKSEIVRRQ